MKIKLFVLTLSFLFLVFANQSVVAKSQNNAISTMAKILVHLNHYPSSSEKKILRDLVSSESVTANERVLATAMINLQHKASSADGKKLREIIDGKHSASELDLAKILLGLSHKPGASDRKKLESMIR